jgi:uncharacterized protein (TIGR03435 family)
MLLALLINRFQLKFHRQSKEGVVYLLTRGPKEPKFEPPKHLESRMFFAGLLGGRRRNGVRCKCDDGVHRVATRQVDGRSGA